MREWRFIDDRTRGDSVHFLADTLQLIDVLLLQIHVEVTETIQEHFQEQLDLAHVEILADFRVLRNDILNII